MKLGSHILIEFFDCNTSTINSLEKVEKLMVESVHISGATLIRPLFHQFSPHGISGVCVVAESHFAIHTWPEHNYAAVDLFSCGDFDYMKAMEFIGEQLGSMKWHASIVDRGIISPEGKDQPLTLRELTKREKADE